MLIPSRLVVYLHRSNVNMQRGKGGMNNSELTLEHTEITLSFKGKSFPISIILCYSLLVAYLPRLSREKSVDKPFFRIL